MTANPKLNAQQTRQVEELRDKHGVDLSEVNILSDGELWLGSKTRLRIARESERFKSIESRFSGYFEEPHNEPGKARSVQVFYNTAVVDNKDRTFDLPGVATIGEKLWNGAEADPHELALSRSMAIALDAAGFNPLGRARSVPTESQREEEEATVESSEAAWRLRDLKRIHALARTVELIKGSDERAYRSFLIEFYRVNSSSAMDKLQRASLMNKILEKGPAYARSHGGQA